MPAMDKRGIFASDDALTRYIIKEADNTEAPFFFFAVTLQGHGPYEEHRYAKNTVEVDAPTLSDAPTKTLATYTQGVKEADQSLKMLMDWAKKRRRETIIVMFGDHLPPLGDVYTESGYMPNVVATRKASVPTMKREHKLHWSFGRPNVACRRTSARSAPRSCHTWSCASPDIATPTIPAYSVALENAIQSSTGIS